MRIFACLCFVFLAFGCVEDADPKTETATDANMTDDASSDADTTDGSTGDAGPANDAETVDDTGTVDMAVPPADMSPEVIVNDCASACQRIDECGRQDLYASTDACISACERVSEEAVPQNWFDCLQLEGCGLLQLCRLPEPRPMTCEEVCGALDSCGDESDLDCLAVCTANNEDGEFSECGEFLYGGACGVGQFWSCVGDTIFSDCVHRCEVGVECNVLRADGCLQTCIGDFSSEDALRALRARQASQCIRLAGDDCRRIDLCVNPQDQVVITPPNRQEFCDAWNECFAQFIPCDFLWDEIPNREAATTCVMDQLRNGCPPDPGLIFEQCLEGPAGPVGPGCTELCEAQFTCGLLDEGVEQFDCVRECSQVIENGDEDQQARLRALFPCGLAGSCEELSACLDTNDPVTSCRAYCDSLTECGLAEDDCVDNCDRRFFRSRDTAHRACVADAAECEAMAACEVPAQLDCARLCPRAVECGLDGEQCLAQCDDDLFETPIATLNFAACVTGAPTCLGPAPSFNTCARDSSPGLACARYCSAINGCAADAAEAMTDCLFACGDGFTGADAIEFAASRTCLENLDDEADCAAFNACIPDPVQPDCAGWCQGLDACEVAPEGCEAACPDDVLAQVRSLEQSACLQEDLEQCADIGDCIGDGGAVEAPDLSVQAFCAIWNRCGFQNFAPCDEIWDDRMPENMKICLINELTVCPPDPFMAFEMCQDGQQVGVNPQVFTACSELCEVDALCGLLDAEDSMRTCTARCFETMSAGAQEDILRYEGFFNCRHALSCDDLAACRSVNSPEDACDNYCTSLSGCGIETPECQAQCDAGFYRQRNGAARRCVMEAGDDCEAMAACAGSTSLPCQYLCDRLGECGMNDADCVSQCDDAHFEDPVDTSRAFACGVTAPRCSGLPSNALVGCDTDAAAGGLCWNYCWARTGCDATQGEEFGSCLIACGEGYVGDDALIFQQSSACIENVDPDLGDEARCVALNECIPALAEPACDDWCEGIGVCLERAECAADCGQDPLSRLRSAEQATCVSDADDECAVVEACFESPEPEVAPVPDRNAFCQDYAACGFNDLIPCDQLFDFGPNEEQLLRCLANEISPCPNDPIELFNACFEQQGPPVPAADYGPVCHRLCQTQVICGEYPNSIRECAGACLSRLTGNQENLQSELIGCRDVLDCPALDACTAAVFGDVCDAPCAQYLDCGGEGFADLDACRDQCNQNRQHPRARPNYVEGVTECLAELIEADGEDGDQCASEGLNCFDPQRPGAGPMTCEEICPRLAQCNLFPDIDDCLPGCLQADRENLAENERIRQCIGDRLDEGQCGPELFEACFMGP